MKNIVRYLVRDADGVYQSAYSSKLGSNEAFKYATLTAKDIHGVIYSVDDSGNETEVKRYKKPEKKKKTQSTVNKKI